MGEERENDLSLDITFCNQKKSLFSWRLLVSIYHLIIPFIPLSSFIHFGRFIVCWKIKIKHELFRWEDKWVSPSLKNDYDSVPSFDYFTFFLVCSLFLCENFLDPLTYLRGTIFYSAFMREKYCEIKIEAKCYLEGFWSLVHLDLLLYSIACQCNWLLKRRLYISWMCFGLNPSFMTILNWRLDIAILWSVHDF